MDTCVDCEQVYHSRCAPEFVDGRCRDCHGDAEHAATARRAEAVFSRQTFSRRPGAEAPLAAPPLPLLGSAECPLSQASRAPPVQAPFVAPRGARRGKLAFASMFSQDAPVISDCDAMASAGALAAALKKRGVRHFLGADYHHDPYQVWAPYDIGLDRERVEVLRGRDLLVFHDLVERARLGNCGALSVCAVRVCSVDVCPVGSLCVLYKLLSCACVPAGARSVSVSLPRLARVNCSLSFFSFASFSFSYLSLSPLFLSFSWFTVARSRLRRECARAHFEQHARGRVHGIGRF